MGRIPPALPGFLAALSVAALPAHPDVLELKNGQTPETSRILNQPGHPSAWLTRR